MKFLFSHSLNHALRNAWVIIKLILPIYILADVLFYYDFLRHIAFLFEPLVAFLHLPPEAVFSIVSGLFLNLYAAIAFAAPLGLNSYQWTVLALFLGIAHSLLVETEIMKKLGISRIYSIILRLSVGLLASVILSLLPTEWFNATAASSQFIPERKSFDSLLALLTHSFSEAFYLCVQIIILVSLLIFFLDFLKTRSWIQKYLHNVNAGFSIAVGVILGITYGAGILISEYERGILDKNQILFIGTFLMICHAIIEDTLLFVIFGAHPWLIVGFRIIFAFFFAYTIFKIKSHSSSQTLK